jgi:hypothetical protein
MGLSASTDGIQSFYLEIGKYYHVPEPQVIVVRERRIPDEEIPVVFFIAKRAHVEPAFIVDLRSKGRSWAEISLHYGLGPEVYYIPVSVSPGPPYGKAYGYFKKKPRKQWNTISLTDDDIVNFVNLRFMTEHYGYSAPDVMRLRSEGASFVIIHEKITAGKHGRGGEGKSKGEGKGKGRKRGKG